MSRRLLVAMVAAALAVVVAVPAFGSTNDPMYPQQWGLQRIAAELAWATSTGEGILVAVVDTGVDLTHPDLAANLSSPGFDLVEPSGTCKKAAGKKGARSCVQDHAQDKNGHGTHVAGIIAAVTGNSTGVAGVAPNAALLPVRVLDEDATAPGADTIADGIRYAADQGADVINLSLGYVSGYDQYAKLSGELDEIHAAIEHAWEGGAVIVGSAGNDSFPLCAEPAAARYMVCVGATDSNDLRTYYSNGDGTMSRNFVVAPGGQATTCAGDIISTVLRGIERYCSATDGYDSYAGTSMAAPHVSGVAALLAAQGSDNTQIVACLMGSADDLGAPGRDPIYGYGRINAHSAVTEC